MSMIAQPLVPEKSRQDEILHAAARLFAARGFDGVSFRDVTLETGANRSLILYHFHSKEELWRSAMRHIVSKFDAQIAKLPHVAPDRPDSERIANMLRNFLNTLIAVPEYGQVLMREGVMPARASTGSSIISCPRSRSTSRCRARPSRPPRARPCAGTSSSARRCS